MLAACHSSYRTRGCRARLGRHAESEGCGRQVGGVPQLLGAMDGCKTRKSKAGWDGGLSGQRVGQGRAPRCCGVRGRRLAEKRCGEVSRPPGALPFFPRAVLCPSAQGAPSPGFLGTDLPSSPISELVAWLSAAPRVWSWMIPCSLCSSLSFSPPAALCFPPLLPPLPLPSPSLGLRCPWWWWWCS